MGKSAGQVRNQGEEAFFRGGNPEEECPYDKHKLGGFHKWQMWHEGWNKERKRQEGLERAQESRALIGHNWEDPESDLIAAVRQIQEILDEQLRDQEV